MDKKLDNGLRVKVWKHSCGDNQYAGGFSIESVRFFSSKLILELSVGEPFECAYEEAERLAVLVDAELTLNNVIIRTSTKGEYK
jgi:hypothetical protein